MNKLQCLDPSLGDALLDAARPTGATAAMSREQLQHVEECASCRLSVERVRRLASAYRDLAPTNAEIGAARLRYAGRATRRHGYGAARRWHLLPRAVTVALLLAVVASAAAQIAARRSERLAEASKAASAGKRPHHHRGHARHRPGEAPNPALPDELVEAEDPTQIQTDVQTEVQSDLQTQVTPVGGSIAAPARTPAAVTVAPPVAPPAEQPPAARPIAREAPAVNPPVTSAPPAPARPRKAVRHAPIASEPAAAAAPREELTAASWQAVAAALRANNHGQAEHALNALAEATDLRTRDAARLARAQLWLSQGKVDRARADLQDLAATGVTSIIRQSAREALLSIP